MKILSLCTSAGLWDKAWLEAGHEVVPGCELMPHKRAMYETFCGGKHLVHDIKDLPDAVRGQRFDGVIGGIPCQSRSKMRSFRDPKFPDLLPDTLRVLDAVQTTWALLENVTALDVPKFFKHRLNAMHFGSPHQSRERWFTHDLRAMIPEPLFTGSVDDLMAYPVVAGRVYGPKRGAVLQGWPEFAKLNFPCSQLQEALADGVPRGLADAWIRTIEEYYS
jgi:C-5 cytosine-specific DNA methylase